MAFLAVLIGYFSRGPVPLKQGQQFEGLKHRLDTLARIMHKFSTASTKSSGVLHRLCDPQAGTPDPQAGAPARGATHSGRRFRRFVTRTYA